MKDFSEKYLEILTSTFKGLNLTRITEFEDFKDKQVFDSIEAFRVSQVMELYPKLSNVIVDVGFGGGFPILPLSIMNSDKKFLGIDSKRKKVDAVAKIASLMGISNCRFLHERLENIIFDIPCLVTFKAVGRAYDLLSMINNDAEVVACFYKGPSYEAEERQIVEKQCKDWERVVDKHYKLNNLDTRRIICFRNVPRGTIKYSQTQESKLVRLSSII